MTAADAGPLFAPPLFARPRIVAVDAPELGADGSLLLRSAEALADYPATVISSLRSWARADPSRLLVAERGPDGGWQGRTYGQAVAAADAIGQALLDRGLGPGRPLLLLSGNSVSHLLVTLGAMTAGVPVAPVSVAYSVQSRDHARIREIAGLIRPGAVFAEDAERFRAALDALAAFPAIVAGPGRPGAEQLADLLDAVPGPALAAASAAVDGDAVAKILFTSGSTGAPKGVINTHRMLAANQQMIRQAWPFLAAERPVIVDWLPWSHTFGGNHNVNMVLTAGGTLYVDAGRPAPGLFAQTIANLTDVPPTIYFNVPAGYAQLVPALEDDPGFAARFFSRLRLMFNAAAALPEALRDRLGAVAERTTGRPVPVTGSWGATETAPAVTSAHFDFGDARCIGVPLPGASVRLVPADGGYEIRAKGPMVTPGYFGQPGLTAEAFDADGFYRTGDAVALADPDDLNAGLVFRGRIAEDFKLATGTFVRVGAVRTALLSAVPILADAVLAGENRDCVCALVWLNAAETRKLTGADPESRGELIVDDTVRRTLGRALAELAGRSGSAGSAGSAARVERLVVMARPADLDAGEVTDKGYVNQRTVLARRAALVEMLYTDPAPDGVVVAAEETAEEGGSPVCLAHLVCPDCGAVTTEGHRAGCPRVMGGGSGAATELLAGRRHLRSRSLSRSWVRLRGRGGRQRLQDELGDGVERDRGRVDDQVVVLGVGRVGPVQAADVGVAGSVGRVQMTPGLVRSGRRSATTPGLRRRWPSGAWSRPAYGSELRSSGLPALPPVFGDWSADSGYAAGRALALDRARAGRPHRGFTAVFAASDQMALGVMHAFREARLAVPADVSVAGFGDIPEAAHFWPPLRKSVEPVAVDVRTEGLIVASVSNRSSQLPSSERIESGRKLL